MTRLKIMKWELTAILSDGRIVDMITDEDTEDEISNYLLHLETKRLINENIKR
jgi:hypothetical protein